MLGNITIDKSSMVLNYFLYTIQLIKENGGKLERTKFEREMAHFVGVPVYNDDGKANRTPYNKSKFPRSFGFVESVNENDQEFLRLTGRGEALSTVIGMKKLRDNSIKYFLTNRNYFMTLMFYSLCFDSFGKNNCGAEQSFTDIEPPKIVLRVLLELGKATAQEIYYVLYGLNGYPKKNCKPIHQSFEEAIEKVRENRKNHFSYKRWIDSWELKNLVNDCKIINIFTEKGFDFLSSCENKYGEIEYSLSKDLTQEHLDFVSKLHPYYKPLFYVQESDADEVVVQKWLRISIYGKFSSYQNVFRINIKDFSGSILDNKVFVKALKASFANPKTSVYLEFNTRVYQDILKCFADCENLLDRINDVQNPLNGWSVNGVNNRTLYNEIISVTKKPHNGLKINQILRSNMVRLPSNFNIIGV